MHIYIYIHIYLLPRVMLRGWVLVTLECRGTVAWVRLPVRRVRSAGIRTSVYP